MYIYIVLMIFILFIIYIIYISRQKNILDIKNENIYFMSADETESYLKNDIDNYVKNLTALDLYARNVANHNEYIDKIILTAISFTPDEKRILIKCANNADDFFRTTKFEGLSYSHYLNGNDIADIKWNFAYTYKNDRKEYEEGLPHTRDNIIFLSKYVMKYDEHNLTNTLIHEKIHIYQRNNSMLFAKILSYMNYITLDIEKQPYKKYIRSNPDTDGKVYYDILTNKELVCIYRSDKPASINDIIIKNYSLEHPYEKIAYEIANHYYRTYPANTDKYIKL